MEVSGVERPVLIEPCQTIGSCSFTLLPVKFGLQFKFFRHSFECGNPVRHWYFPRHLKPDTRHLFQSGSRFTCTFLYNTLLLGSCPWKANVPLEMTRSGWFAGGFAFSGSV